jgi:uncharacterized membrane protein
VFSGLSRALYLAHWQYRFFMYTDREGVEMNSIYLILLVASIALVGTHVVPSIPSVRARIVSAIGEKAFSGVYSLLAIACIGTMVWAFNRVPQNFLWVPSAGLRHIPSVLMPIAFFLAVGGLLTRNPTTFGMEGQLQAQTPATGIVRVTRHPFLWGVVIWSVAHILANGDLGSLIFFGGFFFLATVGMVGIDRKRAARYGDEWQQFVSVTSSVPFVAILSRRNTLRLGEIGWKILLIAVVSYLGVFAGHRWLFGVVPY